MALTQIEQQQFNTLTRRQAIFLATIVGVTAVSAMVASTEPKRPKFHQGAFSDAFSSDFDIDRTTYPIGMGLTYVVAGRDTYLQFGEDGPMLSVGRG